MGSIPVRVTRKVPTHPCRNFFVSEPVRESKGRPRRGGKHAGGMFSRPWEIPPGQDLAGKEPHRLRWGAEPSRGHQKSSDTPVSELFCIRTRTGIAGQGPEPPRYQPLRRPKYPLGIVTGQKSRETSGVRGAKAVGPADLVACFPGRGRFPPDRTRQGRNPTK